MKNTSTLFSQHGSDRLLRVALDRLHAHPLNANLMPEDRLAKLISNIEREEGRYPPVIVRPHPELADDFQLLDGHQRCEALRRLGAAEALCFLWPCDDQTALVLLATLNRLEGEDLPIKRAELLSGLAALMTPEDLAELLPESAATLQETIGLLRLDADALLVELAAAGMRANALSPRAITFAVLPEDEQVIEAAVARAAAGLTGSNRRGRALALICLGYLESVNG